MKNFRIAPALAALTITLTTSISASVHAQTILGGHYDNNKQGAGYIARTVGSPYSVTPTATFDNNADTGLIALNAVTTINGGTFEGNLSGLDVLGGMVTINGGTFSNNIEGGVGIGDNTVAVVTGGAFSGNGGADISADAFGSVITVYGTFARYGALAPGNGYFTGTLENTPGIQTIHYGNQGTIILAPAAVPEASTMVCFGLLLALGVGGSAVWKRRQLAG